jgi:hypothetical protein
MARLLRASDLGITVRCNCLLYGATTYWSELTIAHLFAKRLLTNEMSSGYASFVVLRRISRTHKHKADQKHTPIAAGAHRGVFVLRFAIAAVAKRPESGRKRPNNCSTVALAQSNVAPLRWKQQPLRGRVHPKFGGQCGSVADDDMRHERRAPRG